MEKKIYRYMAMLLAALAIGMGYFKYFRHKDETLLRGIKNRVNRAYDANDETYYDKWHIMSSSDFVKAQIKGIGEKVTYHCRIEKSAQLSLLKCDVYDHIPARYMDNLQVHEGNGVEDYLYINHVVPDKNNISYEELDFGGLVLIDLTLESSLSYPDAHYNSEFVLYSGSNEKIENGTLIFDENIIFLGMDGRNRQDKYIGAFALDDSNRTFHLIYVCKKEVYEAGGLALANYDLAVFVSSKKNDNMHWQIKLP